MLHHGEQLPQSVKVSTVTVRPPYDVARIAVLRKDGSIAFDAYNAFASSPVHMLRGAVEDALSPYVGAAYPGNSAARADWTRETTVTALALDCRQEGKCEAFVALTLAMLDSRRVLSVGKGEGREIATGGDFSAAFARAFAEAFDAAFGRLRAGMKSDTDDARKQ